MQISLIHQIFSINWADFCIPGVSFLEKVIRPIIIYFFLIIGFRLAGKRELAQISPFDIVVLITISNAVQNAIIGNDNSVSGGIIGAVTLLIINYIMARFLYQNEKLDSLIEGDTDVLIQDGKVNMKNLKKELMSLHELEMAAHKQSIASLEDVDRATIDPNGVILFIEKKPTPEVSRHQEILNRLDKLAQDIKLLRAERI